MGLITITFTKDFVEKLDDKADFFSKVERAIQLNNLNTNMIIYCNKIEVSSYVGDVNDFQMVIRNALSGVISTLNMEYDKIPYLIAYTK